MLLVLCFKANPRSSTLLQNHDVFKTLLLLDSAFIYKRSVVEVSSQHMKYDR